MSLSEYFQLVSAVALIGTIILNIVMRRQRNKTRDENEGYTFHTFANHFRHYSSKCDVNRRFIKEKFGAVRNNY